MKKFHELTEKQKQKAIEKELQSLLEAILDGMRFNDELNGDDLQKRIDLAVEKADQMRTPWFAHEYIMDTCGDDLKGMAEAAAEEALYAEANEYVSHGIIERE